MDPGRRTGRGRTSKADGRCRAGIPSLPALLWCRLGWQRSFGNAAWQRFRICLRRRLCPDPHLPPVFRIQAGGRNRATPVGPRGRGSGGIDQHDRAVGPKAPRRQTRRPEDRNRGDCQPYGSALCNRCRSCRSCSRFWRENRRRQGRGRNLPGHRPHLSDTCAARRGRPV